MNRKLQSENIDVLYEAVGLIETREEFYNFFEDLCTITELQAMAHRFAVAKMLTEGYTYQAASRSSRNRRSRARDGGSRQRKNAAFDAPHSLFNRGKGRKALEYTCDNVYQQSGERDEGAP